MVALVVSFYWIEGWFCHHGRLYAVSFETASRDTQTLNLSRNVSKFYARQVVSDDLNLVPRSLVDEAEGEIWQSKKICFS